MTELPPRNHNSPPDPLDEVCAEYEAAITEAANWLDGTTVTTEAQMLAVDAILADIKGWRKALEAAKKSATAPLHDAWRNEIARWKPTEDDQQRIEKGLVALVDGFKRRLHEEKEAARKAAEAEAWAKTRAAQEAARKADASNLDAQREADAAMREAEEAQRRADEAARAKVKGLRSYDVTEILDHRAFINWIAVNRKDDLAEWMEAYAKAQKLNVPGVVVTRKEKRAV